MAHLLYNSIDHKPVVLFVFEPVYKKKFIINIIYRNSVQPEHVLLS